ncbi:probable ATP-dependent RNA helicase DDX47 [Hydractinia symbiolongicarpus]|uniref:probable ATP-dependent RNA helicase DDX47 n=1 Tax=Hydractinia symbiolongicarpus TaxID=13093 RepID=UPI00254D7367|nr:probable ATP-dependent RNA helicase DDX47 [Hydractinia symbiolongicarpus]
MIILANMAEGNIDESNFEDLGINEVLCQACTRLGWKSPTKIQKEAIPVALEGKDVIALAETGSGKTGAFALPVLHTLLENPQRLYALVLTPTRELAFQISEQFEALGSSIGIKCAVIVGGIDIMTQSLALTKKPHVIIATPGRLVDHLENTKGFNLRSLKYLIMDEADRILNMDFEEEVDKILKVLPKERHTYLFSATMTKKVQKLQRASLQNPVKVEVSTKFQTVEKLQQSYIFIPNKFKDCYLVSIMNDLAGNSFMIFCGTCNNVQRICLLLRHLGFHAIPLHGQMSQSKRLGALNKYKSKTRTILVATDVASRGLDIPHVDIVINFDIPTHSKDYIHRVGRTARAGRSGRSITFVTQYDVELYQRIEQLIGKKLPLHPMVEEEVMLLVERVTEAQRYAKLELKEMHDSKKRSIDIDDESASSTVEGLTKKMKQDQDQKRIKKGSKFKKKFGKR